MRTRHILALLATLPLAACIFGGPNPQNNASGPPTATDYSRAAEVRVSLAQTALPRGGSVSGVYTFCPDILFARGAGIFVYDSGRFRLTIDGAAALGIEVAFTDGDTVVVPEYGDPAYAALPPVEDLTRRHCISRAFTMTRSAQGGELGPNGERLNPQVLSASGTMVVTGSSLPVYEPGVAASPPTLAQCAAGHWSDGVPPAAERVSPGEFDAAAFGVGGVMVARSDDTRVLLDIGDEANWSWQQRRVADTQVPASDLRLAVPRNGPQAVLAWRDTNFTRPPAEQTRVMLAWPPAGGDFQADAIASGPESALRGLQLAVAQGEAVVGWVANGGLGLRRVELGTRTVAELAPPPDLPELARVRALRLASDGSDESLVLALALQESDGVQRLRLWRRSAPGADWVPLPALVAGTPAGGQTLGDLSLAAASGEVLMAWTWGDTVFSSLNASQQLRMQRWSPGAGWRVQADTATLADPARRYATQALSLQVAAGCGGAAFLAWNEPADYPFGAVHGAVAGASAWDTFGRANLAPLPGGTGAFSGQVRLMVNHRGRPLLAALLAPPAGGPASVVVRRYAPN